MKAKYHFIVLYLERILSSDIHKAADSMYNEKMSNQHSNTTDHYWKTSQLYNTFNILEHSDLFELVFDTED